MEIFMRDVSWSATRTDIVLLLAEHLHHADFMGEGEVHRFNFHVHLFRDKRKRQVHSGSGTLTVPSTVIGERFLTLYGEGGILLKGKIIQFSRSRSQSGSFQLANIRHITTNPYIDPLDLQAREQQERQSQVPLLSIQFCWECRDQILSIESEARPTSYSDPFISFDKYNRRFRVQFYHEGYNHYIVISFSQIEYLTAHTYRNEPAVVFTLLQPPTYEVDLEALDGSDNGDFGFKDDSGPFRRQLSFLPLPSNHHRVAPYTSHVLRFVCKSRSGLQAFIELSKDAGFTHIRSDTYIVEQRNLFSEDALQELEAGTRRLAWSVSFQVEAIVRNGSVDVREMLDILPDIHQLGHRKGKEYLTSFLRYFAPKVYALYRDEECADTNAVRLCFESTVKEYNKQLDRGGAKALDASLFESYHLIVTPTRMLLEGPTVERSNRVIRAYRRDHHESFLRVSFEEEGRLQLRFDKEVDGAEYVESRIQPLLLDGLQLAGRKFKFLAYSQSALKEHSVWFVKPFRVNSKDEPDQWITARDIIASLGNFANLTYDKDLIYCPARYGARISQAFTATEASINVEIEEIIIAPDILTAGEQYSHTDGVGTMSKEVAREVGRAVKRYSSIIQVRIQGAKGMLSIDHTLKGRIIVLRDSMIKFDAPSATNVEIARVFDRPTAYFLNRPLIMILEGLGVPYEAFKKFQDMAVRETEQATETLSKAGKLLDCHGLGTSYRISSVMNSLGRLGITSLIGDTSCDKMMEFSKNHVLRDLKHHARIPIPGAWTLVGVADVHKFLKEGQIFACVRPVGGKRIYLEGPVVISRSPTIHPGDVQVAHAIGRPPARSCFEKERLVNSVVFSVLGDRPLPSCLGGGDLDGDIYNIIPLTDPELACFKPDKTHDPATYAKAVRKTIDKPSTMRDVAQFVMDYLLSDILGLIAITWLVIADQAKNGILDRDCITLANLHSDAVDYPKSGNPVDRSKIPRRKRPARPDWNAPETVKFDSEEGEKFYESQRAIGRLFRAIDLPAEHSPMRGATRIASYRKNRRSEKPDPNTSQQAEQTIFADDDVYSAIEQHVEQYLPSIHEPFDDQLWREAEGLLSRYTTELQGICITKTLSTARSAHLAEEEALIGTIVQKTSQPRRRKDMMARLRESTDTLIRGIREVLEGGEHDSEEEYLQRSWYAFSVALDKGRQFGAQSFVWVALGATFEAVRRIEQRDNESLY